MRTAVILGGNGQIGVPTAAALARDGWAVRVLHRGMRPLEATVAALGVSETHGAVSDPLALARAVGEGADLLVDCVGHDATDAQRVLASTGPVSSAVVISSAAVYTDEIGRALGDEDAPQFPVPIGEHQATVPADATGYAGGKVRYEQAWLASGLPVTVLRPGAIHGRYARNPREWYVLKRILDGRRDVVLAYGGSSRFHTTAALTVAELVRLAAARPGRRVLNAADPQALTAAEIVAAVAADRGQQVRVHTVPGEAVGGVGMHPWAVPHPMVLDMAAAARELGYRPVTDYAGALGEYLDWLEQVAAAGARHEELTDFPRGEVDLFDYAAEDAWLAVHG